MELPGSLALDHLDDEQKLAIICELVKTMSQEFKNKVINEIVGSNAMGETDLTVTSNDQLVSINFGKPLAWFAIPKAFAVQLGVLLMEHAGATVQQIERPKADAS